MADPPKSERQRVVFGLQSMDEDTPTNILDEEREKHRSRATKFGVPYQDPARSRKDLLVEAKRERLARPGFTTGFNFFSEEEIQKRAERAKRWGLATAPSAAAAAEEEAAAAAQAAAEAAEKLRLKAARAAKFGTAFDPKEEAEKELLMDADLFEARSEAPLDVPRREVALYLYGVDCMSTVDVLSYFDRYSPSMVEWINDSACVVVFGDAGSTLRAMHGKGHAIPPDVAPPPAAAEGMPGPALADLSAEDAACAPYLWFKGVDFLLHGKTPVKLIYRMATSLDARDIHAEKQSRYLWQQRGRRRRGGGNGAVGGYGGGNGSSRKRSRQRPHPYDDEEGVEGMEWEGEEGEEQGEYGAGPQHRRMGGPRGGRKVRRKRQQQQQPYGAGEGDGWQEVDMEEGQDWEEYGTQPGGDGRRRGAIVRVGGEGGTAAAAAAAGITDPPPADLRELLRRRPAATVTRQTAQEDGYEEVPQPDA